MNNKDICVQKSTISQIPSIYSISKSCIENSWSITSFEEDFNNMFSQYFSLLYKDSVIGFLSIWVIVDEITITNIAIDKEYRGLGLSNYLMDHLIENFKSFNIFLEVRESNKIARALYEKFNFKEIGKRDKYYKSPTENAIIMKKF